MNTGMKELDGLVLKGVDTAATWLLGLAVLLGFVFAAFVVEQLIKSVARKTDDSRSHILLLSADVARMAILIAGCICALGTLGVNVNAIVASLGLTGFALGFAFKDVLGNLLAGAMILFYRPFSRGERIKVTDFEGIVLKIDLRYTTLVGDGKTYLVPNSNLLSNVITVHDATVTATVPPSPENPPPDPP